MKSKRSESRKAKAPETYRATVDVPARFRKSKSVGAVFGLTCAKYQSGESERTGAISRCGDEMMRTMLYEAAQSMLFHSTKWSWLKAWAGSKASGDLSRHNADWHGSELWLNA